MKTFLLVIFFVLSTLGHACDSYIPCEKTYVQPSQIQILESGIFVTINEYLIPTSAIHIDTRGLYFADYRNRKEECESPNWKCSYCGQCNATWYSRCPNCHVWR